MRGALAPAVRAVLDRATATDPAQRYPDVGGVRRRRLTGDALGSTDRRPPLDLHTEIDNPYKGLRAFGAADAGDFFGRERLVERLIARLGDPGTRGRFVAVVGPSGSGKSSVVRAGLLPALAAGRPAVSAEWFRIDMTPAPHPFEELEVGARSASPPTHRHRCSSMLLAPDGVRRVPSSDVLPDDETQLLLVIDQFEELFTQVDDDTATGSSTSSSRRHRRAQSGPRRRHPSRRLLRPAAASSGSRRAAPRRHRGDHTDVARRARNAAIIGPAEPARRRRSKPHVVSEMVTRDPRPPRAPSRCCSTR